MRMRAGKVAPRGWRIDGRVIGLAKIAINSTPRIKFMHTTQRMLKMFGGGSKYESVIQVCLENNLGTMQVKEALESSSTEIGS